MRIHLILLPINYNNNIMIVIVFTSRDHIIVGIIGPTFITPVFVYARTYHAQHLQGSFC